MSSPPQDAGGEANSSSPLKAKKKAQQHLDPGLEKDADRSRGPSLALALAGPAALVGLGCLGGSTNVISLVLKENEKKKHIANLALKESLMGADSSLVPEGAVTLYYPPLSIPKSPGTANNDPSETKQCSVRGCTLLLPLSSSNKVCEMCRGKHRVYASTKRARRKMEKAAVAGVVAARARVGEVGGRNGGVTAVWMPLSVGDQSAQF